MSDDFVLSEVHLELRRGQDSTRFHFAVPDASTSASSSDSGDEEGRESTEEAGGGAPDGEAGPRRRRAAATPPNGRAPADGDACVRRRDRRRRRFVAIRHCDGPSPISRCGEQVWRGACLLADAALAPGSGARGWRALELGCGAGLLAALSAAALRCPLFFATDAEPSALALAAGNAAAAPAAGAAGEVFVRRLSWLDFLHVDPASLTAEELLQLLNGQTIDPPASQQPGPQQQPDPPQQAPPSPRHHPPPPGAFAWTAADVARLATVDTLLAGDVIYDPPLTEAFVHAAACLARWIEARRAAEAGRAPQGGRVRVVVAGERRYNFTLHDWQRPRAAAWEDFLTYVDTGEEPPSSGEGGGGGGGGGGEGGGVEAQPRPKLLRGRRLALPPQALEYDRSPDLELWELYAA
ncbi:hypothetical protein Rsub_04505 [Raphidocelis subcapitata]|uniref:Methyltransferase n=1 Tax=Raphidocelis subcapitata TaxID=307507 RepID=A0A2V0NWY9_9CHLO|nr:hypothetical protein Rsub_04505 [Raphidocelis subcapitata]|eukprot:GBF92158.1 hypothetical protein Rsub_04505 [Raphidocelis subcapitata]